jgi:hypothetical protein
MAVRGEVVMAEPNRAVPFLALNGCLREDFLQRVLHRTLAFLPRAAAPSAPALVTALRTVAIPGFRQLARAPVPLQARAAVSRFRASGPFVGWVLEVWIEATTPLASAVEQFLERQGVPRDRVRAEAGQFSDRWSLDEALQWADRFRAEEPTADRDEVALLLCCLTNRAPIEDTAEPSPQDGAAPEEATPAAAGAPAPEAAPPSAPSPSASTGEASAPPQVDAPASAPKRPSASGRTGRAKPKSRKAP